jgi:hypothetical protein
VSWLGPLPVAVPGLPGLTGALLLWAGAFLLSALYVLPLAVRSWQAYAVVVASQDADADAERLYALGQALARSLGVLMVLAGLAAGLTVAFTGPILTRRALTPSSAALILALLLIAVAMALQSIALDVSQRAAAKLLRRRPSSSLMSISVAAGSPDDAAPAAQEESS